jgi:hypothetical protein
VFTVTNKVEPSGVGRGAHHRLGAEVAGRTGAVFHHHGSAQALGKLGSHLARDQIDAGAWRERHDQLDRRTRRTDLRACRGRDGAGE